MISVIIISVNQKNIAIFNDTLNYIDTNQQLKDSVSFSIKNTILYKANSNIQISNCIDDKNGIVTISLCRTFEAAIKLHSIYYDKKIGVLNFASATNPGGGVTNGSSAQEESLCRCSTLFPVLNTQFLFSNFYHPNRVKHNPIHDDAVIYTPNILICKTDADYPIRTGVFVAVDVLSCAAPNLRERPSNIHNYDGDNNVILSEKELLNIHLARGEKIIKAAIKNNIDILVLGAFGCGAFKNNPSIVAEAYSLLMEKYRKYFDVIEFAIYCNEYNKDNYYCFKEKLNKWILK